MFKERPGDRGENGDLRARGAEEKTTDFRFKARPGDRGNNGDLRVRGAEEQKKGFKV